MVLSRVASGVRSARPRHSAARRPAATMSRRALVPLVPALLVLVLAAVVTASPPCPVARLCMVVCKVSPQLSLRCERCHPGICSRGATEFTPAPVNNAPPRAKLSAGDGVSDVTEETPEAPQEPSEPVVEDTAEETPQQTDNTLEEHIDVDDGPPAEEIAAEEEAEEAEETPSEGSGVVDEEEPDIADSDAGDESAGDDAETSDEDSSPEDVTPEATESESTDPGMEEGGADEAEPEEEDDKAEAETSEVTKPEVSEEESAPEESKPEPVSEEPELQESQPKGKDTGKSKSKEAKPEKTKPEKVKPEKGKPESKTPKKPEKPEKSEKSETAETSETPETPETPETAVAVEAAETAETPEEDDGTAEASSAIVPSVFVPASRTSGRSGQACFHQGVYLSLHSTWFDIDHCNLYVCTEYGVETTSLTGACLPPPSNMANCRRYRLPNQCCYTYDCPGGGNDTVGPKPCIDDNGIERPHNDHWVDDPLHPCKRYLCADGVVVVLSDMRPLCPLPPSHTCVAYQRPNMCCNDFNCTDVPPPLGCVDSQGIRRDNGQIWYDNDVIPCRKFVCNNGSVELLTDLTGSCAPPPGPGCVPVPRSGQCCPTYANCSCVRNGVEYIHFSMFPDDPTFPCKRLRCENGTVVTLEERLCPTLSCSSTFRRPGRCCYECVGCIHLGIRRPEGSFWYDDPQRPCIRYTCTDGQVVEVNRTECASSPGPGCQPVLMPGDCCEMFDCSGVTCPFGDQIYHEGDVWVDNPVYPCKWYTCRRAGVQQINSTFCPPLVPSNCPRERDPGQCCFHCQGDNPTTCVYQGQTYPENAIWTDNPANPCKWFTCLRTGVQQINSTFCPPLVPSDCPRERDPGQCCFRCQGAPVTCVYQGQTYLENAVWTDNPSNPCKWLTCKRTGVQQISNIFCPPLVPSNCPRERDPGQCCFHCQGDPPGTCVYQGQTYPENAIWTDNPVNPCKWFTCRRSGVAQINNTFCPPLVPSDCPRERDPGQCCYHCQGDVPVTCVYQGQTYLENEIWTDDPVYPCKWFTCRRTGVAQINNTFCPPLVPSDCQRERDPGQCCFHCQGVPPVTCVYQGQTYPENAIWTDNPANPCKWFTCLRTGVQQINNTFCPPLVPSDCPRERDPGQCCFRCQGAPPTTCVYQGQTYPENAVWTDNPANPCKYFTCRRTGVQQISNIFCPPLVPSNCPRERDPGQCCFRCQGGPPLTCVYQGQTYPENAIWTDNPVNPCKWFTCLRTGVQQINSTFCPPLVPSDCPRERDPGQCCFHCQGDNPTTCVYQGQTYPENAIWTDNPANPCKWFTCLRTGVQQINNTFCPPLVPSDCPRERDPGQCCFHCQGGGPVTCVYQGQTYQENAIWTDDPVYPCKWFTCLRTGVQQINSTFCPPLVPSDCPRERDPGQCCFKCQNSGGSNCIDDQGNVRNAGELYYTDPERCMLARCVGTEQIILVDRTKLCPGPPNTNCTIVGYVNCCPQYLCHLMPVSNCTDADGNRRREGEIYANDEDGCLLVQCVEGEEKLLVDRSSLCPLVDDPNCVVTGVEDCCPIYDCTGPTNCLDSSGRSHPEGDMYYDDAPNNCVLVECRNGLEEVLLDKTAQCDPPPENPACTVQGTVDCCPIYQCPNCVYNGTTYPIGALWWDNPRRQCIRYRCSVQGLVEQVISNLPCPEYRQGCLPVRNEPACCHFKYNCMFDADHNLIPMAEPTPF